MVLYYSVVAVVVVVGGRGLYTVNFFTLLSLLSIRLSIYFRPHRLPGLPGSSLVTPRTALSLSQLVHPRHALLEFVVLALLVAVALVLLGGKDVVSLHVVNPVQSSIFHLQSLIRCRSWRHLLELTLNWEGKRTHTALPRQVVCVDAATVQGDEEVRAAISVGEREFGVAHFFPRGFCW